MVEDKILQQLHEDCRIFLECHVEPNIKIPHKRKKNTRQSSGAKS